MNLSLIILISNEIKKKLSIYTTYLLLSLPHNTCTLPNSQRQKSDTYRMYRLRNIFSSIEMVTNYNYVFENQYCFMKSQETHKFTLLKNAKNHNI